MAPSTASTSFTSIEAMLGRRPAIDAVSLCMPPQYRYEAALQGARGRQARLPRKAAGRDAERSRGPRSGSPRARACRCLPAGIRAMRRPSKQPSRSSPRPTHQERPRDLEGRRPPLASEPGLDLAGRRPRRLRSGHQRAVDRHAYPAQGDVPDAGHAGIPGEPRRADRSRLCISPTPTTLPVHGRIRLAPDRQAELGHRRARRRPGRWCLPKAARSS